MNNIEELNTNICDWSYEEGLNEIIEQLETIQIDTRAMNDFSHCELAGKKEMLEKVINYLKRCL